MKRNMAQKAGALYGALMWAYPGEFRGRFGEEMRQVFDDLACDAYAISGSKGLIAFCLRAYGDLALNAFLQRSRGMKAKRILGIGVGFLAMLPATIWMLGVFLDVVFGIEFMFHAWENAYNDLHDFFIPPGPLVIVDLNREYVWMREAVSANSLWGYAELFVILGGPALVLFLVLKSVANLKVSSQEGKFVGELSLAGRLRWSSGLLLAWSATYFLGWALMLGYTFILGR